MRLKSSPVPTRQIPIFPLGTILCPGGSLSLKIFEERYMQMAKASLKTATPFGIALIREGAEVGIPAVPEAVGTIATIEDWDMPQLGILQVKVSGGSRFRIRHSEINLNGLIIATIEDIKDDANAISTPLAVCTSFLAKIIAGRGNDINADGLHFDDAFWVSMRLMEMLPLANIVKQKMLELTDATIRLEILQKFLQDQGLVSS